MLTLKVFLSSPGDVAEERRLAAETVRALESGPLLRERVNLVVVAWDDPMAGAPLDARETPQGSVNRSAGRPADCDLTIVILWSRLGTPLPARVQRADGSRYASGTVWEVEDAIAADRPVFVYRRTDKPRIELDDPDFDARRAQYKAVQAWFESLRDADGAWRAGVNEFSGPAQFQQMLRGHLESFIGQRLAQEGRVAPASNARSGEDTPAAASVVAATRQTADLGRGSSVADPSPAVRAPGRPASPGAASAVVGANAAVGSGTRGSAAPVDAGPGSSAPADSARAGVPTVEAAAPATRPGRRVRLPLSLSGFGLVIILVLVSFFSRAPDPAPTSVPGTSGQGPGDRAAPAVATGATPPAQGGPLASDAGRAVPLATPSGRSPAGPAAATAPSRDLPTVAPGDRDSVTFRAIRPSTYAVLALVPEAGTPAHWQLRIRLRLTTHANSGGMNFWSSSFRLVIDGVPRAPTSTLNEIVDSNASKDGDLTFDVPWGVQSLALRITHYAETADLPLAVSGAGARAVRTLPPGPRRVALDGPAELRFTASPRSIYTVLDLATEPRRPGVFGVRIAMRLHVLDGNANFWDATFRLLVDGVARAPDSGLNELVEGGSAKDADLTFEVPEDARQLVLRVIHAPEQMADVPLKLQPR